MASPHGEVVPKERSKSTRPLLMILVCFGVLFASTAGRRQASFMHTTEPSRAGYVLVAGPANAGKSTLLNALVGERVSIVGPKAQTTWQRVAGIRTEDGCQMVLVDTPGLLDGGPLFHRFMAAETAGARRDADVALVVLNGADSRRRRRDWPALSGFVSRLRCTAALAVNKADAPGFDRALAERAGKRLGLPAFEVSAKREAGFDALLKFVRDGLPPGPFLYPADEFAAASVRFLVQELVREAIFERYRQELPYSVAVRVEEFREQEDPVYVAASLFVERKSQKGMLVGKGGSAIRALGRVARHKIEAFLGARVYLDLWVKVWEGWRRKKAGLATFGYHLSDE